MGSVMGPVEVAADPDRPEKIIVHPVVFKMITVSYMQSYVSPLD